MSGFFSGILDLLYPRKCAFCRRITRDGRMVCPECEKNLPFPAKEQEQQNIPPLALCLAPLYYTGKVRESLLRYKFHGAAAYCGIYAEFMAGCLQRHGVEADRVSWVPLSRQRLRRRGYDQAKLLAEQVSKRTGIPCERLIIKTKNNPAQSGRKSREERAKNVQGVYRAIGVRPGERIILIDDIVTTGATLKAAATELLGAGAASVTGLAAACAERDRSEIKEMNGDNGYADI